MNSLNKTIIDQRIGWFLLEIKQAEKNMEDKTIPKEICFKHITHCKSSINTLQWVLNNCQFED